MQDKPLIIQSDRSLMLDVHSPSYNDCRDQIIAFSELVKAPEHVHTYQISAISLWNATSAGLSADEITERLTRWSKFAVPASVFSFIKEQASRYGKLVLLPNDEKSHSLEVYDPFIATAIASDAKLKKLIRATSDPAVFEISTYDRGTAKLELIRRGYPVDDRIPLVKSDHIPMKLCVDLRDYQKEALGSLLGDMGPGTGFGTIVMPCGSGKTVVGMGIMCALQTRTLILCPNVVAVHQWINEICSKTDISPDMVGEYSGEKKEIKPITVCTYQVLTYRQSKDDDFVHMNAIRKGAWGLVIYDEVHMLPAPVFKITAELQSVYRAGLTATLIREDGREEDVFSLVGPKRFDIPWTDLSQAGWIADAYCIEMRVPLSDDLSLPYAVASKRDKYKIASTNPEKEKVIEALLSKHMGESILIIGQYLDQLKEVQKRFGFPMITGSTSNDKRDQLYASFRDGTQKVLIVSKVANFAIDLPDASVAIQISGTFGSRQEEAQRLGRILRPKSKSSFFYSVITKYTVEEEFSSNRQRFLVEQGYRYETREI
ncbi:MAG: helicase-associated domain-containing protein [Spirochaetales bacterium]|nr:helicase-associated domain-containing protein [Spirochaetales bacterium]